MRLAGTGTCTYDSPEEWVADVRRQGYTAYTVPLAVDKDDATVAAYVKAAREAGIVISELGAWTNPIDPDPAKAKAALEECKACLHHADRLGARCCINIGGTRNPVRWYGPHPDNFSPETFDMIVAATREIVDAVKPLRTFYALETDPWMFPSSTDEYVDLLRAIDRPTVAAHLDPVNFVTSPARAFRTGDLIREFFAKLGPRIRSCHAKDVILSDELTVHLDECRPGTGMIDWPVYLRELAKLERDTTLFIEHNPIREHPEAARFLHSVARQNGLELL